MPTHEAREIAAKLTHDEAYILMGDDAPEDWEPVEWTDDIGVRLVILGLAVPTLIENTDLGRAVAAALREGGDT